MAKRVLLVDGRDVDRQAFQLALETEGHEVTAVADGFTALETIDRRMPDLVVLDLRLPELSGADVLRVIRTTSGWEDIPVLMVTGLSMRPKETAIRHAGRTLCLDKPCSTESLLSNVNQLLAAGDRTAAAA